jgi:hypothetical protein
MSPLSIELGDMAPKHSCCCDYWSSCCFLFEGEMYALVTAGPGLMSSMAMPSLSHQTENFQGLNKASGLAKGTPSSERMASSETRLRNSRSKAVHAVSSPIESSASHNRRKRAMVGSGQRKAVSFHCRT